MWGCYYRVFSYLNNLGLLIEVRIVRKAFNEN